MEAYALNWMLDAYCGASKGSMDQIDDAAGAYTPADATRIIMEARCDREEAVKILLEKAPAALAAISVDG